jgi:hypothetical protein
MGKGLGRGSARAGRRLAEEHPHGGDRGWLPGKAGCLPGDRGWLPGKAGCLPGDRGWLLGKAGGPARGNPFKVVTVAQGVSHRACPTSAPDPRDVVSRPLEPS